MGFNCTNCGECCGPIPVTYKQLVKVRRNLRSKPKEEIERLRTQPREPLTCPLLDIEKMRCSVYEDRPEICRMFGFYKGMVCPNNKKSAVISHEEGKQRLEESCKDDEIVGIMSMDITWDNLIRV